MIKSNVCNSLIKQHGYNATEKLQKTVHKGHSWSKMTLAGTLKLAGLAVLLFSGMPVRAEMNEEQRYQLLQREYCPGQPIKEVIGFENGLISRNYERIASQINEYEQFLCHDGVRKTVMNNVLEIEKSDVVNEEFAMAAHAYKVIDEDLPIDEGFPEELSPAMLEKLYELAKKHPKVLLDLRGILSNNKLKQPSEPLYIRSEVIKPGMSLKEMKEESDKLQKEQKNDEILAILHKEEAAKLGKIEKKFVEDDQGQWIHYHIYDLEGKLIKVVKDRYYEDTQTLFERRIGLSDKDEDTVLQEVYDKKRQISTRIYYDKRNGEINPIKSEVYLEDGSIKWKYELLNSILQTDFLSLPIHTFFTKDERDNIRDLVKETHFLEEKVTYKVFDKENVMKKIEEQYKGKRLVERKVLDSDNKVKLSETYDENGKVLPKSPTPKSKNSKKFGRR